MRDAALAAHALHERGIAHRDIKPANILLAEDGGRLSDLGLSQLLTPGIVVTGLGQIGLEFTDPQIMLGAAASRASDIWSLGACLHYAMTGAGVYGDLHVHRAADAGALHPGVDADGQSRPAAGRRRADRRLPRPRPRRPPAHRRRGGRPDRARWSAAGSLTE